MTLTAARNQARAERPIQILIFDTPSELDRLVEELTKLPFAVDIQVASDQAILESRLENPPDIVVSEVLGNNSKCLKAIRFVLEKRPYLPFLILTTAAFESVARSCVEAGACDYLLEDHLSRLGPAVTSALTIAEMRECREQAEHGLGRYAQVFELASWGISLTDLSATILGNVNAAYARMHGYEVSELIGKRVDSLYSPDSRPEFHRLVKSTLGSGIKTLCFETIRLRKDGSTFPAAVNATIVYDRSGKPTMVAANVQDITQTKATEDALRKAKEDLEIRIEERTSELKRSNRRLVAELEARKRAEIIAWESEHRFRMLTEAIPQIVWTATTDGLIDYLNPQWFEYTGRAPQESFGARWQKSIHPDEQERAINDWHHMMHTGQKLRAEYRLRRADGDYRWHMVLAIPMRDVNDQIEKWFGTCTDVDDQKRTEEALRASELRFRKLVEANVIGIIVTEGSIIKEGNDVFLKMIGRTRSELEAGLLNWREMTPPQYLHLDEKATREGHADGASLPYEKYYIHRDGTYVPILMGGVVIDHRTETSICFVLDLSERKHAEANIQQLAIDLARSNRELEQFASMASHDLQEPLRTITSYVSLLSRKHRGEFDSESQEYIGYVLDATHRMRELIQKLLTYSRVGRKIFEPRDVDCGQVVQNTVGLLKAAIEESRAEIQVENLPIISGDITQIGQLFQNLLTNAIKFRGVEPPQIRISACRDEVKWQFMIEDNGIGIASDESERIFQMFHRSHGQNDYPGSGIGLALCKKIVENHGGTIWVESVPGAGSCFHFSLPAPTPTH